MRGIHHSISTEMLPFSYFLVTPHPSRRSAAHLPPREGLGSLNYNFRSKNPRGIPRGFSLLLVLCLLEFLQHLQEEPEEHEGGDGSGHDVGDGLCQVNGESLIRKEHGQNEDQGDQQEDLS